MFRESTSSKQYLRSRLAAARFALEQFVFILITLVIAAAAYGAVASGSWHGLLDGATYAAVIGAPLILIEIYGTRLPLVANVRRWPFLASLALKSAVYAAWILGGAVLSDRLHFMHHPDLGRAILRRDVLAAVVIASIVVNLLLAMSRLLGVGTLRSIMSGRYHRPRREQRAFAFVDIRGSVSIEDRIGDLLFYSYVAEIFGAIERAAIETGGDVLDYIGDQVVLSWPVGQPGKSPFMFVIALAHQIISIQINLLSRYGVKAAVRASIHVGDVVAGEIGEFHRKIMLLGSAVNIAARVEQIARDVDVDCIATSSALEWFEVPKPLTATSLGLKRLRGKTQAIEVFHVHVMGNREAFAAES